MLQISEQDLTSLNTLGLRAHARALLRYRSPAQLPELSAAAGRYAGVFILGGGSNVVLAPALDCLVVKVESRGVALHGETGSELIVEAQAGENWHDFVAGCVERGWNGLENLALIPGTVGAAPVQNIGAYGVELDQRFHSLVAWDMREGRAVEMGAADCQFSYRNSFFKQAGPGRWLILKVRFGLPRRWRPVLDYPDLQGHPVLEKAGAAASARQIFDAVCEIRRRKLPDPAVLGNAGSFFKNPIVGADVLDAIRAACPEAVAYPQGGGRYKLAAGWLIDRAGWKGRRMGPVGVHERQALVLVNHGGATAQDIGLLAEAIRADVASRFGVRLEQEPVMVGA
ncbi:UDP-N-acetylmuramate dehydrogenase [Pollutimonas bauzanensis]|uniref:UDP-N-acetylenolpyruvoylglucosamine reductase n=1 Tax=Pollutimonas bauzanensis TaxID=658167 RepID=A0A1M5YWR5_9BURK|nr:UDP-N-acetylmuramate dehydrogenase [Pollutimonas bauzanensis]